MKTNFLLKFFVSLSLSVVLVVLQIKAFAATGIYIELAPGFAKQRGLPSDAEAKAESSRSKNFPVARASVGYLHDFNEQFGVGFEAGRGYYGKTSYQLNRSAKTEVKSVATDFLLVLSYHVQRLDFVGKIGGNRNTVSIDRSIGSNSEQCKIQPVLLAETVYNFNSHWALTMSYLHSFGSSIKDLASSDWKAPGVDALLVGLRLTFW